MPSATKKTRIGTTSLTQIVLDSNVVLKWFLPDEAGREPALRLRAAVIGGILEPVMPSHLPLEVAAGLTRAVRRRRPGGDVLPAIDAFNQISIELVDVAAHLTAITALAMSVGISVYDAAYVFVGQHRAAPLVTADEPLQAKAAAAGHDVILLSDVPVG